MSGRWPLNTRRALGDDRIMVWRSGLPDGAPGQGLGTSSAAETLVARAPDGGSSAEAAARLSRYGPNELPRASRTPLWRMAFGQLRDPLVVVLLLEAR